MLLGMSREITQKYMNRGMHLYNESRNVFKADGAMTSVVLNMNGRLVVMLIN